MNILAVDIGGTSIKMALVDKDGNTSHFQEVPTESEKGGPFIVEKVRQLMVPYKGYEAIGISTAGQVDVDSGTVVFANPNIPNYSGTELKKIFEAYFDVPVKVENDVNAAAIGENKWGAGKEFSDFLCLTYGTGVGGAIIMKDAIYRGHRGLAAEFGHMLCQTVDESPVYYEQLASTRALIKQAQKVNPTIENGRQLFAALATDATSLQPVVDKWLNYVSFGLISLVHSFNPSAIILGGGIMEQKQLIHQITIQVKKGIMPSFSDVVIKKAALGNQAGLLGAAALHMQDSL